MTFLSLIFHRSERESCQGCVGTFEACNFQRQVFVGRALEGGMLTWLPRDGGLRSLQVAMTWDVLAQLRQYLDRHAGHESDNVIVRAVLCQWGIEQYQRRLQQGLPLPAEGLVLESLGGPCSARIGDLLRACGLLPEAVAS